jgi:hypothetical protein
MRRPAATGWRITLRQSALRAQKHAVQHRTIEVTARYLARWRALDDERPLELEKNWCAVIERSLDIVSLHCFFVLTNEVRGFREAPPGVYCRSNSRRKLKPKVNSEWSGQGISNSSTFFSISSAHTH